MSFAHNQPEYRVSELAGHVKRAIEDQFAVVRVRGEISKCGVNGSSGHAYITLKDEGAVLESVCWRGTMSKLTYKPEVGMEVIATGRLTTYPGRSQYQLVIEALEPAGEGALMAMLEARKKALAAEGLFAPEHKKPIPFLPQTIGIITSPTGAVIRDMLHRIAERFPRHVVLWPVAVQGAGAAEQVAAAIAGFNAMKPGGNLPRPDVLIVARGGGSVEDLWAFNEEIVVRAAFASDIPLISAVGHETDTTLIDFASDHRAPTPTAAAERAVPVRRDIQFAVEEQGLALQRSTARRLDSAQEKLTLCALALARFPRRVEDAQQKLDDYSERLRHAPMRGITAKQAVLSEIAAPLRVQLLQQRLQQYTHLLGEQTQQLKGISGRYLTALSHRIDLLASKLSLLDVQHVLARGFALVKNAAGVLVTSQTAAMATSSLTVTFRDGSVTLGHTGAAPVPARKPARKAAPKATSTQESLF